MGNPLISVTQAFGLPKHVPFLDVFVDTDTPFVLDPSAVRNSRHPLAVKARGCLESFFTEVIRCRDSATQADQHRGRQLLEDLHEPNQTRLGLTEDGSQGKAFGPEMGRRLWAELGTPVCQTAALTSLEDLPLFVPRVGKDLTSDLTTRVIFGVLIEYTQDMMKDYPSLASGAVTLPVRFWDPLQLEWHEEEVCLPFTFGKQLLVIPMDWTSGDIRMAPIPFYNNKATQTLQVEQTVTHNGMELKPSKRLLKKQHPDVKKLNSSQTVTYLRDHDRNLVQEFREDVDRGYEAMTPEEAALRIARHRGKAA